VNEIELSDSENEECSDHEEVDDSESDYDSPEFVVWIIFLNIAV
jgi:hypothetical protein